jgi:folate-binding Fe-S cluster repair protein YgfZ
VVRRDAEAATLNAAQQLGVVLGAAPLAPDAIARLRTRLADKLQELTAHATEVKVRTCRSR